MSGSGDDSVHVLSYLTGKRVARFPVGFHPQRVRNGVARLDIYPQAGPTPPELGLRVRAPRTPVKIAEGMEGVGCRATGGPQLAACAIRIVSRRRTLAVGDRIVSGRKGFLVDVDLTKAGSGRLSSAGTARATIVALREPSREVRDLVLLVTCCVKRI